MMMISRGSGALMAATLALGLLASGCARSAEAPPAATSAGPTTQTSAGGGGELAALVPTPAKTTTSKGPDPIAGNGIHRYFKVDGAPEEVMAGFRTALEGKGWQVSPLSSHSGDKGDGGAKFTGTLGDAYGVFEGGGYQKTTYIDVCAWPAKPAETRCDHRSGG